MFVVWRTRCIQYSVCVCVVGVCRCRIVTVKNYPALWMLFWLGSTTYIHSLPQLLLIRGNRLHSRSLSAASEVNSPRLAVLHATRPGGLAFFLFFPPLTREGPSPKPNHWRFFILLPVSHSVSFHLFHPELTRIPTLSPPPFFSSFLALSRKSVERVVSYPAPHCARYRGSEWNGDTRQGETSVTQQGKDTHTCTSV